MLAQVRGWFNFGARTSSTLSVLAWIVEKFL
jgi:hypothetical protein